MVPRRQRIRGVGQSDTLDAAPFASGVQQVNRRLSELSAFDPYIWVRCLVVMGIVGVVIGANAWAISADAEPGLSSSMEPASGLHPSGFDPTIAGEQL